MGVMSIRLSNRSVVVRSAISAFILIVLISLPVFADETGYRSFVDRIGKMVFAFAWPTATYESVNLEDVRDTSRGVEISFRLHGRSAFGGGPLWTDVIVEVSNGRISDLHWGDNNAILAQPGETMKAIGSALDDLSREYQRSQGSSGSYSESAVSSDVVGPQLARLRGIFRDKGYIETHNPITGNLRSNSINDISVTLRSGTSYLITSICDQDCSDIDILLYDQSGKLITSDQEADDQPVVSVSPYETETYTIRVRMVHCSREPCNFGTQIFGK